MKPDPITDNQLFDTIHEWFGIGDWNPSDAKGWHQVRATEIAKIKALRKRRRYTIAELAGLAKFCHEQGYTITSTWDLSQFWPQFRRAARDNERLRMNEEFDRALEIERGRLDGEEWVGRLLRAQGPGRMLVLAEWKEERT